MTDAALDEAPADPGPASPHVKRAAVDRGGNMIHLHRIKGEELVLNADLIELIEARPDTVITLIDGRKIVVQESPATIVDAVRRFRAGVLASAEAIRSQPADLLAFPGGKTDD